MRVNETPDLQAVEPPIAAALIRGRVRGRTRAGSAVASVDNRAMSERAVTISEVARRAGVSTATVSRVISGFNTVNAEMAERVRLAAEELGYRPNAAARGLATGTHRTIAVVIPDLGNPYFNDIIKGINALASRDGQHLLVADSQGDPAIEQDIIKNVKTQVDSVLLLSSRLSAAALKELAGQQLPVLLVNRIEFGVDLPVVAVDNFSAMLELCAHLMAGGHRHVVYVAGSPLTWQNRERWRAMNQAAVMGIEATMVQAGDATIEAGYDACEDALAHTPTAIVCFNDLIAVGVLTRLQELGISVPQDISVTGFDDTDLSRYVRPALTTVNSPKNELAEKAWRLLSTAADQRPGDPVMLTATVIPRDSSGPAPTHRPKPPPTR